MGAANYNACTSSACAHGTPTCADRASFRILCRKRRALVSPPEVNQRGCTLLPYAHLACETRDAGAYGHHCERYRRVHGCWGRSHMTLEATGM